MNHMGSDGVTMGFVKAGVWSLECTRLVDSVDGGMRDRCQTAPEGPTEATDLCHRAVSMQQLFDRFWMSSGA